MKVFRQKEIKSVFVNYLYFKCLYVEFGLMGIYDALRYIVIKKKFNRIFIYFICTQSASVPCFYMNITVKNELNE